MWNVRGRCEFEKYTCIQHLVYVFIDCFSTVRVEERIHAVVYNMRGHDWSMNGFHNDKAYAGSGNKYDVVYKTVRINAEQNQMDNAWVQARFVRVCVLTEGVHNVHKWAWALDDTWVLKDDIDTVYSVTCRDQHNCGWHWTYNEYTHMHTQNQANQRYMLRQRRECRIINAILVITIYSLIVINISTSLATFALVSHTCANKSEYEFHGATHLIHVLCERDTCDGRRRQWHATAGWFKYNLCCARELVFSLLYTA